MAPLIKQVTVATLAGILNTISNLPGGFHGSNVTDFNDKAINILPDVPGPYNVGVTPVVFKDYGHRQFPLCDDDNYEDSNDDCFRPRQIITSLFYPSCPPPDTQRRPVVLGEEHFAPVFTETVLEEILHTATTTSLGNITGLHNLMSRAVTSATACPGQFPLVVFAPDVGGQRQAYTQAASELASMGYIVLTVDSPFLSGVVENPPKTFQRSLSGGVVNEHQVFTIQNNDLWFIHKHLATVNETLGPLSRWTNNASVQVDHCIFGHGSGGSVAQAMIDNHVVRCGGRLEGTLALPAPFNGQVKADSPLSASPSPFPDRPETHLPGIPSFILEFLQAVNHLRNSGVDVLKGIICRLEGTCGTRSRSDSRSLEKRNVADDPWYFPEYPYHKKPWYDDDCDYGYHKGGYGYDCDDDKWCDDYDDHYWYDYDPCDDYDPPYYDPCDYDDPYYPPYDPPYYPPQPYPSDPYSPYPYPSRPFPPPGIFPPNMTWPPYGDGKLPYGNTPWDDHWDDYPNSGSPYRPRYGHKYYDHYHGGYPYGCDDYGDDLDCNGYPDHHLVWDRKKYCHGWIEDYCNHRHHYDHDDDDHDDYDDNNCEDYDDDCDSDYDYDNHDDHGDVDDWDEEDHN
ncbi:hypothetical protein KVR01_007999 [Diaporthe batatas]|uniref:uncharacterized protein n=1 Tax=Diaporthe batatas TaxID=748121 RepID=UPI001D04B5E0|nr:uncharacterized protein KVR01_007999 [Diaporthe batatas]KAG8162234.1 hypothetical protein KVR01_007999 [Diaporthe batatas]